MHLIFQQVIDPLEGPAHADRPGDGRALDLQDVLDFIQNLQRRAAVAVHLVDEGEDGRSTQPTDLHQLDGSRLDAARDVDDHQG